MISIAITFLENEFSFKLDLYFMKYMHVSTQNDIHAPKIFLIEFFFNFIINFLNIVCLDQSQKSHLFYKKKLQSLN